MVKQCACIIPFFNEGKRILPVLNVISSLPEIYHIICVDDGSTDNSYELIRTHYPQVTLIKLPKNTGKSHAVKKGLESVKAPLVLLMDADLYNLQKRELEKGITYMIEHPEMDMLIFRRKYDILASKLIRGDILVSGVRIVKTLDLKKVFEKKFSHYQIETAINYSLQDQKKRACWMLYTGKNVIKARKVGFVKGTAGEIRFLISAALYQGIFRYLYCIIFFCHKKIV